MVCELKYFMGGKTCYGPYVHLPHHMVGTYEIAHIQVPRALHAHRILVLLGTCSGFPYLHIQYIGNPGFAKIPSYESHLIIFSLCG